ncbi:hypothetical protein LX36DRAFT_661619 [Colletotrichum falcatum]|nr:hypothetical protein LX36DRAFT_661619 [Colletotrichum falcatum]
MACISLPHCLASPGPTWLTRQPLDKPGRRKVQTATGGGHGGGSRKLEKRIQVPGTDFAHHISRAHTHTEYINHIVEPGGCMHGLGGKGGLGGAESQSGGEGGRARPTRSQASSAGPYTLLRLSWGERRGMNEGEKDSFKNVVFRHRDPPGRRKCLNPGRGQQCNVPR